VLKEEWDNAIRIGERNREIIELLRRHCAHAVVERPPFGGRGLLEAQTGLPIDMRTVRCPHAAHRAAAGMQLEGIALSFWRANCRGCPHRAIRAVPNLTNLGESVLEDEARQQQRADRHRQERERERAARRSDRAARIAGEPPATRSMVALLDGIDAEEPDARAERLVDEARAAPERCTREAGRVFLDTARVVFSDRLLEALDHLQRADRIPPDSLREVALLQLAERPSRVAAAVVVRLRAGLCAGELSPVLRSLVWLGGRSSEPFDRSRPYRDGLVLAADVDLSGVLDELRDGLTDAESSGRRGWWAWAASELMRERPETAAVLAEPIVRALNLPESLSPYAGSPNDGLREALQTAFEADPTAVDAIYRRLAAGLDDEQRKMLFHAYEGIFRDRESGERPSEVAVQLALDAVFARMTGDWGAEVADDAVDALDFVAHYHSELLSGRVDAVFGALLTAAAQREPSREGNALLRPASPLSAMEQASRAMVRQAQLSKLRDVVGRLAPLRPEDTLRGIEAVLDDTTLPDDDATSELRGHAVRLLGDLGRVPALVGRVLPRVVTFALGRDVVTRTRAIEALGVLAREPHRRLPDDVLELLPIWLADPYRGPHRAAVDAMRRGLPVIEEVLSAVIVALANLARAYTTEDERFLNEVLEQLWQLSRRLDTDTAARIQRWCLKMAEHLSAGDLENFVRWEGARTGDRRNDDLLADRLLQLLQDGERATNPNRDQDPLMRLLRDLPPEILVPRVSGVMHAARQQLPFGVLSALEYVEVLQRAGTFGEAEALAQEVLGGILDTIEQRGLRAWVRAITAAARVERAYADDNSDQVAAALDDWGDALHEHEEVESQRREPWEMM
jgi:hypothetical protein